MRGKGGLAGTGLVTNGGKRGLQATLPRAPLQVLKRTYKCARKWPGVDGEAQRGRDRWLGGWQLAGPGACKPGG